MSWRTIIVKDRCKLELRLGYLISKGIDVKEVHISEIGTLVIENTAISLTSALLCELIKNNVKIIFCDEKRNPISELLPYYGCHDCVDKIQEQICWAEDIKAEVWDNIIIQKINNQRALMEKNNSDKTSIMEKSMVVLHC